LYVAWLSHLLTDDHPNVPSCLDLLFRHLERARIIFAIEHEMGEDERAHSTNKYWTVLNGKRYLQVMVEDPEHFRKDKKSDKPEEEKDD
jgi:hypothetical protein